MQFDMIAALNGWDDHTKALELATSLTGDALAILTDLEPWQRRHYPELVKALVARFEPDNQSEVYRAQLKVKTREGTETLTELAQDIKKLVRKAYPNASLDMREIMAKDSFVDALNNADMEWSVFHGKPQTLCEAVTLALEYEAFHKGRLRRKLEETGERWLEKKTEEDTQRSPHSVDDILRRLEVILRREESRSGKPEDRQKGSPGRGKCSQARHYKVDCEKRRADCQKICSFCLKSGHYEADSCGEQNVGGLRDSQLDSENESELR